MTTLETDPSNTQTTSSHRSKIHIAGSIFWWMGLLLLSPAFITFFVKDAMFEFFENFPSKVDPSSIKSDERFLFTLLAGFGCWILCIFMRFISLTVSGYVADSRSPVKKWGKRIIVFVVTSLVLCAAIFIAFILWIGIGLYYTPR